MKSRVALSEKKKQMP